MTIPKKKLKYEHPTMVPLKGGTPASGECDPGSYGSLSDPHCDTGCDPESGTCLNGSKAGSCDPTGHGGTKVT